MKKLLMILAAMIISLASNAQVLYKISGNGLKKPSYVIGTCHVVKASFLDTIPGANRVIDDVEQVYGELDMRHISNQDTLLSIAKMMMLPSDSVATEIMTEQEFDELCRVVNENYNIDLKNPQYALLLQFYPVVLMTTIGQVSEMMKLQKAMAEGTATESPEPIIDMFIQQKAIGQSKPVFGLEYYSFQVEMLTTLLDMPLHEQYVKMIESFGNKAEGEKIVKSLVDAYKSFNLASINDVLQSENDFGNVESKVFDSRNENWAQKMPSIMSEKSTLFAVGVGHLIGDKGILNLLKKQGYKVKAVKK
ncbi:MAG: TraB/GumN family protein [Bacteroidales bacterium]|nr:TraB/GumN family protein [Bacteroidales bacterium]